MVVASGGYGVEEDEFAERDGDGLVREEACVGSFVTNSSIVEVFFFFSDPSTSDITWKPVSSNALEHLEITNSGICMKSEPIKERRAFWKSIPDIEDTTKTTVTVSTTATKDTSKTASKTESKGIIVPVVSNLLGNVLGILG